MQSEKPHSHSHTQAATRMHTTFTTCTHIGIECAHAHATNEEFIANVKVAVCTTGSKQICREGAKAHVPRASKGSERSKQESRSHGVKKQRGEAVNERSTRSKTKPCKSSVAPPRAKDAGAREHTTTHLAQQSWRWQHLDAVDSHCMRACSRKRPC